MGGGVWAGGEAARPHPLFPCFPLPTPQSGVGRGTRGWGYFAVIVQVVLY